MSAFEQFRYVHAQCVMDGCPQALPVLRASIIIPAERRREPMEEELLLSPAEVVVLPLTSFTSAEEMNHCCIPTAYAHTCIVLGLLWSSRATQ